MDYSRQANGGEAVKFYVLSSKSFFRKGLMSLVFILSAIFWHTFQAKVTPAYSSMDDKPAREIHLVTGEFSTKTPDGEEIEVYRFDPGTIFINHGEKVHLKILGINGEEHPFYIEGTGIQGTVKKGQETVVPIQFHEKGIYRLICITHQDKYSNGPMIAYIIVQ